MLINEACAVVDLVVDDHVDVLRSCQSGMFLDQKLRDKLLSLSRTRVFLVPFACILLFRAYSNSLVVLLTFLVLCSEMSE